MQLTDALFLKLIALGLGHAVDGGIHYQSDWEAVMQLALSHGLDAVAFDGLNSLIESDPRTGEKLDEALGDLKYEWFGFCLQCEQDYADYLGTLRDLIAFYNTEDIPVLLLKGYGLSLNYPIPSHRPTGDIDLYLFGRQAEADQLIKEKWGIRPDLSHHHHSVFHFRKRTIENHYDLINVHAHRSSRRLEPLLKELAARNPIAYLLQATDPPADSSGPDEKKSTGNKDAVQVLLPCADFNAIFLLRHAASHFASAGINLRQALDWLQFVEHHHAEVDWKALYDILKREYMERFVNTLNDIGVQYLGFDPSLFPQMEEDSVLVQRILDDILHSTSTEKEDGTLISALKVKPARWWANRWKHRLCYSDSLFSSFFHSLFAKILKPRSFLR